mgnify:FL=1|jgi:hypothetical protein|tara:strand:- start:395 stop:727 length:333 start_codon:yes stop_codon:yes gene_type:complete
MKKDTVVDGLKKETFSLDEMEKKIVVNEEVNIDSHLKHNKILLNQDDGYSKSRDLKRVASIPTLALSVWAKEYNGDGNWFALPKEVQSKILKTKLNSNEFKYFRTAEGKI